MKKPFFKKKWVWVVGILIVLVGGFEVRSHFNKVQEEKAYATATKNADKVLKGKVLIPETYFKTKNQVAKLFDQAGLKVDFTVVNFDEKATLNKKDIKVGDCDQLDSEQPNVKYYDTDAVGDKYGFYADKGATIIVGYSDHNYDGAEKESNSSTESQSSEQIQESSSSQTEISSEASTTETSSSVEEIGDITLLSPTPNPKQQTILRTLGKQAFDNQYPYKGSKMHSIMGIIQDWTQKDDHWFFKCEATINNAFNAKKDTVIEITIVPTGPEAGNVTILNY